MRKKVMDIKVKVWKFWIVILLKYYNDTKISEQLESLSENMLLYNRRITVREVAEDQNALPNFGQKLHRIIFAKKM